MGSPSSFKTSAVMLSFPEALFRFSRLMAALTSAGRMGEDYLFYFCAFEQSFMQFGYVEVGVELLTPLDHPVPVFVVIYLASLLHFSNVPRQLRSSTSQQLSIPRTKLNLGKRAFSVAAPIIWNELPTTLKSCESLASFRKNLKTYLFKIAFPP